MKKVFNYVLFNGAFLACLVAGVFFDITALLNIAIVVGWFTVCLTPIIMTPTCIELVKKEGKSVPVQVDFIFDLVVFALFASGGFLFLSGFYLVHTVISASLHYGIKNGDI